MAKKTPPWIPLSLTLKDTIRVFRITPLYSKFSLVRLKGTSRYTSICNHYGMRLFTRDDIESLAYVLIYFILGRLLWVQISWLKITRVFTRRRDEETNHCNEIVSRPMSSMERLSQKGEQNEVHRRTWLQRTWRFADINASRKPTPRGGIRLAGKEVSLDSF